MPFSHLSGTLDASFSAWTNLETISLSNTGLSGTLAPQFRTWGAERSLDGVFLGGTQLSGTISPNFASWTGVRFVILSSTQMSGTLHPGLSAMSQLRQLVGARCARGRAAAVL
jgi:hypothetical protein